MSVTDWSRGSQQVIDSGNMNEADAGLSFWEYWKTRERGWGQFREAAIPL